VDFKATTCIILVSHPPFGTTPMRAGGYILLTFGKLLGSMQGMFGASVSELYLLVIEDSRSMCDHQKRNTHAYTGTVSQAWL